MAVRWSLELRAICIEYAYDKKVEAIRVCFFMSSPIILLGFVGTLVFNPVQAAGEVLTGRPNLRVVVTIRLS